MQRNVDFAAQWQCFVDVALVASIWLLCALLGALAASMWPSCAILGALAGSIWLPCALLGALAASIWVPCALLGALAGSICAPCAFLGAMPALIWLQTNAPTTRLAKKTISLSTICFDAACLVRSATFLHASNLVYIYI